jgi:RNA polymerase sigma-70 factor (ECF subfamily)
MVESEDLADVRVPDSFETLYRENYAAVVALVYALSGTRAVAEDLAQEAFLRAHQDWAQVSKMDRPDGWVRRVALNLARSRLRRLRAETVARLKIGADAGASASALHRDELESEAFWSEVRRLPSRQAQAIALHYIEDLSVSEVAETLGVADGTVKALLHQGRQRLGRQLSAKGLTDSEP